MSPVSKSVPRSRKALRSHFAHGVSLRLRRRSSQKPFRRCRHQLTVHSPNLELNFCNRHVRQKPNGELDEVPSLPSAAYTILKSRFKSMTSSLSSAADSKDTLTTKLLIRLQVISYHSDDHDKRRVFLSEDKNDNDLDCILSKIKIARIATNVCLTSKKQGLPDCDYYYDMSYSTAYSTFANLPKDDVSGVSSLSTLSSEECCELDAPSANVTLLDLYSGCGAMSTGLCHGANLAGLNLHNAWAVDINSFACQSLQLNHPKTKSHEPELWRCIDTSQSFGGVPWRV